MARKGAKSTTQYLKDYKKALNKYNRRVKALQNNKVHLYLPDDFNKGLLNLKKADELVKDYTDNGKLSKRALNRKLKSDIKDIEKFLEYTPVKNVEKNLKSLDNRERGMQAFLARTGILVTDPNVIRAFGPIFSDVMAVKTEHQLGTPITVEFLKNMGIRFEDFTNLERRKATKAQLEELLQMYTDPNALFDSAKLYDTNTKRTTKEALEALKKFKINL